MDRESPPGNRSRWPVRRYRFGEEPPDDLSAVTTPKERLARMGSLAEEAFCLAGRPRPTYSRAETPVALRRLGE